MVSTAEDIDPMAKILLIEDSRIIQMGIRSALTRAGHEVMVANDGLEGLASAGRFLPDLILLDMMLPSLSGTDVLSALKEQSSTKSIPVFVLSGLSQQNAPKLLRAGAARYFEKSDSLFAHGFAPLVRAIHEFAAGWALIAKTTDQPRLSSPLCAAVPQPRRQGR
jgi:CheY-like chemotaxis protein